MWVSVSDLWRGMASRKSHVSELKNWMLRQRDQTNKGCLSIQFLLCISQFFIPNMVLSECLKTELLRVSQKARTVLVRYLLPGIRILVYCCTWWGTSKIYLCLEGNRSSFSRVSLKSEKFSSLSERNYFLKTKISRQTTWRWIILCLMLNSWKWINWGNLATPLKVSRKCS